MGGADRSMQGLDVGGSGGFVPRTRATRNLCDEAVPSQRGP